METLKTVAGVTGVVLLSLTANFTEQRTAPDSADKRSNQGNINPTLYAVTNSCFMAGISLIKTCDVFHVDEPTEVK